MPNTGITKFESVAKYGTDLVQDEAHDEKMMRKPGIRKNKLVEKYGTNFRYMGIVKNGLDRVTVVTSIPIPRLKILE